MKQSKKDKVDTIISILEARYPDAVCSLVYEKPYELLISTRLSAQCTDARVNIVTKELFATYPTLTKIAQAPEDDIARIIKSCGLYKTKARDISLLSKMLLDVYGGNLPDTVDELLKLPGIGRKTANLVVGDIFGKPAIVTDTHCIRISNRLGLCDTEVPVKVEQQLRDIVPPEKGNDLCHRFVLFGRDICRARNPLCGECPLVHICNGSVYKKSKQGRSTKQQDQ